jgi:hypothetical protein
MGLRRALGGVDTDTVRGRFSDDGLVGVAYGGTALLEIVGCI